MISFKQYFNGISKKGEASLNYMAKHNGKILFGTTVSIVNMDTDEEVTYQIVGDDEADVKKNKISVNSPIARALFGKKEGDDVVVKAPGGEVDYEISSVQYQ